VGTYLFGRVLREGKDSRFDALRDTPRKFLAAWAAQAVWCTAITLPVVALNAVPAPALSALPVLVTDVVGLALWAGGLAFESAADAQKARWVSGKKEKLHDEEFMTRGLWRRW
jgi:steroid 5-alpha reductase family enzyme